ncbi:MAG: copper chaperone PCu(A)C [Pseudomonadales bacterium]|nr:copper chaperone PCu(A)C [Pseudomonadales bacterium]
MKIQRLPVYLLLLFIPSIGLADLLVKQPWVAAPPPGSQVLAAYMVLENKDDHDRTLVSVDSGQFKEVQIHSSTMKDGMMLMEHLSFITIPADDAVELSSGGLHMMLMNPQRYFKAGDTIELDLNFKDGSVVKVLVPVKPR